MIFNFWSFKNGYWNYIVQIFNPCSIQFSAYAPVRRVRVHETRHHSVLHPPPPTNSTTGSWGGSWPRKRLNLAEHLNGLDNDLRLLSVISSAGAGIIAHHNFLLQVLIDKIAEFDTHQLQISVATHSQIIKCQIKYHCPESYFNAVMTRERSTSI